MQDLRWKQRFQNYSKAFVQLEKICAKDNLDEIEQAALIKFFEITFELGWKTLKDLLENGGITPGLPRNVIKYAFQYNYIKDGAIWLQALEKRNLMAHTYDEARANEAIQLIKNSYFPMLRDLHTLLQNEMKKDK